MISENQLMSIYRDTVHPLYAYVSRRTGGRRDLAEDIVQETYIRAWQHWHRQEVQNPLAWLKTVAHNLLASHYRKLQPQSWEEAGFDPASETPDLDAPDVVALVQWGLTRIRKRHARILECFYFDGQPVRDIAREWRISERAVEGRLRRARQILREKLERISKTTGGN